jgi:hypothetical protein
MTNLECDRCPEIAGDLCYYIKDKWRKTCRYIRINLPILIKQLCNSNSCCFRQLDDHKERILSRHNSAGEYYETSIDMFVVTVEHKNNINTSLYVPASDTLSTTVKRSVENNLSVTCDSYCTESKNNIIMREKDEFLVQCALDAQQPIEYKDSQIKNIENYNTYNNVSSYKEEIKTYNMNKTAQRKKIVYTHDSTSSSDYSENDSYTEYSSNNMSDSESEITENSSQNIVDKEKIDINNLNANELNNKIELMEETQNMNELTDNQKFINNLKNNLLVLSELKEGYKLWIELETQRLYIDNTIGQSITRRLYGQGKAMTLEFIKRMLDTAELQNTPEYDALVEKSKIGVKNLTNTYKKSAWFGKYPEVDELEKIIDEKGWKRNSDDEKVESDKDE